MAAVVEVKVHGYEEYCQEVERHRGKVVFALFCGDKDEQGVSWCPDCVKAEPIIRGEMKRLPEGSVFIYCLVGDRTYWKDPNNEFKRILKLTGVPTVIKVWTPQKLTEEECLKPDLIQMLFLED